MNQNPHKKNNSKQVVITNNNAGQRIDNFLIRYFGKIPNSRIYLCKYIISPVLSH